MVGNDFFYIPYNPRGGRQKLIYTEEQKKYIVQKYKDTKNVPLIANEFKVSSHLIRRILKEAQVKLATIQEIQKENFPRNSAYFDVINTPEKAYWLGFLYADGCVNDKKYVIRINLKAEDENHLYNFLKAIGAVKNKVKHNDKKIGDEIYPTVYCRISDKYMTNSLIEKGCVSNKTRHILFPVEDQVPKELLSHFIRGYYDGNGSFVFNKGQCLISFTGQRNFIEEIRDFLGKKQKIQDYPHHCAFTIGGNIQVREVLKIIYKDSTPQIELYRKRKLFNQYLLQHIDCEPENSGCD